MAGPVLACAVCIPLLTPQLAQFGKKDSKQLSPGKREEIYKAIIQHSGVLWGLGVASSMVIDKINIHQATRFAMKQAVQSLRQKLKKRGVTALSLVIDGTSLLDIQLPQKAIPKADALFAPCAIASIIAKVKRDRLMVAYHKRLPSYCFQKHKGYGTAEHLMAISSYGPCAIHRMSFSPIKSRDTLSV